MRLSESDWIAVEREFCARKLVNFVRRAWPVVEPGTAYVHGWHIDAIAEHLEAVSAGEINRLLINVPPGTMKSLAVGVLWPAWEWGPRAQPQLRYVGAAHAQDLAVRDNMRMRRLVKSEWYQRLWPLGLAADQDAKLKFENAATGFRAAVAATAMTGHRGDRVLYDDPHSVEGALSDLQRKTVLRVFSETVTTRLNSPERSAIVVVMQRLHEQDLSGHILERELGYEHLCLPMEFEADRRCVTSIGFRDPRTGGRRAVVPGALPGRGGGARQAGDGRARHRRAVPAAPDPARRRHVPDRPLRAGRPSARAQRRSPTRSATGTRPAPRTAAPSPPACCCTS